MEAERKPIGYWLKRLDQLIEGSFDRALAQADLTRRHWQVMNVLHAGSASEQEIAEALQAFWRPRAVAQDQVVGELVRRGWARRNEDHRYRLTSQGEAARAALVERVQALRAAMTDGLTRAQYAAVVDGLRRMAENLEAAA
jgi:DNA-binding MarR family transcriptional regulator